MALKFENKPKLMPEIKQYKVHPVIFSKSTVVDFAQTAIAL